MEKILDKSFFEIWFYANWVDIAATNIIYAETNWENGLDITVIAIINNIPT